MFLLLACAVFSRLLPAAAMEPTVLRAAFEAQAPKVTPAPRYAPQQHRGIDYRGLLRRQDAQETCGYWDGNGDDPYVCDPGLACASNTLDDIFGCCATDSNGYAIASSCPAVGNPYTSCVEYEFATLCTGDCYNSNRVCESTAPYCGIAYSYSGAATYRQFFCQSSTDNTPLLFLYASPTETTSSSSTIRSSTTAAPTPTPDENDNTPASTSTGPSQPTKTSDPDPDGGTSKGAIAGGVIGGLAGLALIVGGAIFFLRRSKKKERKAAIAEVSQI